MSPEERLDVLLEIIERGRSLYGEAANRLRESVEFPSSPRTIWVEEVP